MQRAYSSDDFASDDQLQSACVPICDTSRIVRASWHQGQSDIFNSSYTGLQCSAMVTANTIISGTSSWSLDHTVNQNMIEADGFCALIHFETETRGEEAFPTPPDGYLQLRILDVVKNDILMFDNSFELVHDDTWLCQGSLMDRMNDGIIGRTLQNVISHLFAEHHPGVLVVASM